jgi:hypothetical protein
MPVNEILAPFYSIAHYHTSARPIGHNIRLYFDEVPAFGGASTVFTGYTDADHLLGWTLEEIWSEVVFRAALDGGLGALLFDYVEMWTSEDGVNTFEGFDPDDYTGIVGGASDGVAAAYLMWMTKAAHREQFRLTFFDTANASPQRFPVAAPPTVDDGTLEWFLINSVVGFVTNDNLPLVTVPSINSGYNRKLARSYGRSVAP